MHNKWTFEREWRPESVYIELTILLRAVGRSKKPGGGAQIIGIEGLLKENTLL